MRAGKLWLIAVLIALGAAGALTWKYRARKPVSLTRGELHMGTLVEITVVGRKTDPLDAWLDSAFAEIARIDALASDYDAASAVGRINARSPARGAREIAVPEELFGIVRRARDIAGATDGAFDITTGTATRLWRDAERRGTPPSEAMLRSAAALIGTKHLRLDENRHALVLDPGVKLDFGGIAKGYAVDRALRALRRAGAVGALVNGGGDMASFGAPPGRTSWIIGIRHPRKSATDYFGVVYLTEGAVASSGDYERGYLIRGKIFGHIINPRTARPATRCVSTTVTAPTCETADALATAAFVLGPDSGRAALERLRDVEGLIVAEERGRLIGYPTSGFLARAAIDTTQVRVRAASPSRRSGGEP